MQKDFSFLVCTFSAQGAAGLHTKLPLGSSLSHLQRSPQVLPPRSGYLQLASRRSFEKRIPLEKRENLNVAEAKSGKLKLGARPIEAVTSSITLLQCRPITYLLPGSCAVVKTSTSDILFISISA